MPCSVFSGAKKRRECHTNSTAQDEVKDSVVMTQESAKCCEVTAALKWTLLSSSVLNKRLGSDLIFFSVVPFLHQDPLQQPGVGDA